MKRSLLMALLAAAIAFGCTIVGPPGSQHPWFAPAEPVKSEADRMLEFYGRVATLKGQELAREFDAARKAFEAEHNEGNRVRLAILLSLPSASFRDDGAALGLLQPWLRDKRNESSALRPVALMIHGYLIEVRRSDEQLQTQNVRLRDEQRRAEALQQKLEALLEMEMKMIQREQSAQPRKR